jgi:diguanylate cyclase (GGDEF)-like protein/PAS domain S-box-containing protein
MPFAAPGPNHQSVLLIQGDSAQALAVRAAIDGWEDDEFHVTGVTSCAAALDWLAGDAHRRATRDGGRVAMLLDLFQSDVQGIETFAQLHRAAPHVPILVTARRQDEGLARRAVQHGAEDYLLYERLDSHQVGRALASVMQRATLAHAACQRDLQARATLDAVAAALVCSDLSGTITYLNSVAETMTGWTLANASGVPVTEVLQLVDADTRRVLRPNRTAVQTSNSVLRRRGGGELFVETASSPICDTAGEVSGTVTVLHDVSAAHARSRRMVFLAQHDSLTELPNRLLLRDRLQQAVALARRHPSRAVALLFVDLDGFKVINDSLGHANGDLLLKSVARRLLGCVRITDTVSRVGGDEFVILLPDLALVSDGAAIAENVLRALRAPHRIQHHLVRITASIGVATLPDGEVDSQQLLRNADLAMYNAKASGRDTCLHFDPTLHTAAPLGHITAARQLMTG